MSEAWRCIDHPPSGAAWNMAVDEAILLSALDGSAPPTVRFFQWERPSITFGYMLRVERELNIDLCRERQVPFIRRITGGGVVFHGCDTAPMSNISKSRLLFLYQSRNVVTGTSDTRENSARLFSPAPLTLSLHFIFSTHYLRICSYNQ